MAVSFTMTHDTCGVSEQLNTLPGKLDVALPTPSN